MIILDEIWQRQMNVPDRQNSERSRKIQAYTHEVL